jgi:hypothetical protein
MPRAGQNLLRSKLPYATVFTLRGAIAQPDILPRGDTVRRTCPRSANEGAQCGGRSCAVAQWAHREFFPTVAAERQPARHWTSIVLGCWLWAEGGYRAGFLVIGMADAPWSRIGTGIPLCELGAPGFR